MNCPACGLENGHKLQCDLRDRSTDDLMRGFIVISVDMAQEIVESCGCCDPTLKDAIQAKIEEANE